MRAAPRAPNPNLTSARRKVGPDKLVLDNIGSDARAHKLLSLQGQSERAMEHRKMCCGQHPGEEIRRACGL